MNHVELVIIITAAAFAVAWAAVELLIVAINYHKRRPLKRKKKLDEVTPRVEYYPQRFRIMPKGKAGAFHGRT